MAFPVRSVDDASSVQLLACTRFAGLMRCGRAALLHRLAWIEMGGGNSDGSGNCPAGA